MAGKQGQHLKTLNHNKLILPSERNGKFNNSELKNYAYEIEHNEPIPYKYSSPTDYFRKVKPKIAEISQLYAEGKSYGYIAAYLGICMTSFSNYMKTYSQLRNAMADAEKLRRTAIEHSTVQSALGFTKTIRKPIKVKKDVLNEDGKKIGTEESVQYVEEEIYIPPNGNIQQFLLKNYMPNKYKDKVEQEVKVNLNADNLNMMSTEALMQIMGNGKAKTEIIDVEFTEVYDE